MYSSKDAATPYPTQWALNPTAYQNVDSSQVDWAALAQQWIAMKEAAAIVAVPPPPSIKPDTEEGEAPMEVENTEIIADDGPPDAEWNSSTNSWSGNWNQWGETLLIKDSMARCKIFNPHCHKSISIYTKFVSSDK